MTNGIWYNVNVIISALNQLGIEYQLNVDSGAISTLRCGGRVKVVAKPKSSFELIKLLYTLNRYNEPYYPIGACSNTLIVDAGYNGVLIDLSLINHVSPKHSTIDVGCGARIPTLALKTNKLHLSGFEPLCTIPGSVGGTIVKNAGCFGEEIANLITSVTYLDIKTLTEHTANCKEIPFGYRSSGKFFDDKIVLSVTFKLTPTNKDCLETMTSYRNKRLQSQPTSPSLGSVFKRTADCISAGYYIDKAGLKGATIGGAKVSEKHANFIVNTGSATSTDYLELATLCKIKVKEEFNITLNREIDIIGEHNLDK